MIHMIFNYSLPPSKFCGFDSILYSFSLGLNMILKYCLIKSNRYADALKIRFTSLIWIFIFAKVRKKEKDIHFFFSLVFPIVLVDSFLKLDRRGRAFDVHSVKMIIL